MNTNTDIDSLTETPHTLQVAHQQSLSRDESKGIGQFFTPPEVADYMASLVSLRKKTLTLIDPGAGAGILTAALAKRVCRSSTSKALNVIAFETDLRLLPALKTAYARCQRTLVHAGHNFSYEIRTEDFLRQTAKQPSLLSPLSLTMPADVIIMNPPYFKIARYSEYSADFEHVLHGQPNIYALFMAAGAQLLKPNGELVAITPRSFCDGPYFAEFRRWMLSKMALLHVHAFESRKEVFRSRRVLQESIITHWQKSAQRSTINLSASQSESTAPARVRVPASTILKTSDNDTIIRIPNSGYDPTVITKLESLPETFSSLGLRVSTGPVVSFRATQYLRASLNGPSTVQLVSIHNILPFRTELSLHKSGKPNAFAVSPDSQRLLLPARNYVLLRRFSAKEERRRLVASPYLRTKQRTRYVALENHLNYITHQRRELVVAECFGLCALLNSSIYDGYFRAISGNTQVNATELRRLHLPSLQSIKALGDQLMSSREPEVSCDAFVSELLGLPSPSSTTRREIFE